MAENEITVFSPLINSLYLTLSAGSTKTFLEKNFQAYHYLDSKYANKTMPVSITLTTTRPE